MVVSVVPSLVSVVVVVLKEKKSKTNVITYIHMKMIRILFVSIASSCSVPWIPRGSPGCSGAEWNTCKGRLFK